MAEDLAETFFALAGALALLALGALVPLTTGALALLAALASLLIQQGAVISERAMAAKRSFFMFIVRFFWLCHIHNDMAVRLWHELTQDAITNLILRNRGFAGIFLQVAVYALLVFVLLAQC